MKHWALKIAATGLGLAAALPVVSAPAEPAPAAPKSPAVKPPAAKTPSAPKKPAAPPRPMVFAPRELDLAPGETYMAELSVPNPTGKEMQRQIDFSPGPGVTVVPDTRYGGKLGRYGSKVYPKFTAARDAQGNIPVTAAVEGVGQATLSVRVTEPVLEVVPGLRKLTVKVSSPFQTRLMIGRVIASNPDRFLEDVTTREFKISPGQTQELVFPLPGAAPAEGQKYDFTFIVETYQGYKFKKTYPLEFPPHT